MSAIHKKIFIDSSELYTITNTSSQAESCQVLTEPNVSCPERSEIQLTDFDLGIKAFNERHYFLAKSYLSKCINENNSLEKKALHTYYHGLCELKLNNIIKALDDFIVAFLSDQLDSKTDTLILNEIYRLLQNNDTNLVALASRSKTNFTFTFRYNIEAISSLCFSYNSLDTNTFDRNLSISSFYNFLFFLEKLEKFNFALDYFLSLPEDDFGLFMAQITHFENIFLKNKNFSTYPLSFKNRLPLFCLKDADFFSRFDIIPLAQTWYESGLKMEGMLETTYLLNKRLGFLLYKSNNYKEAIPYFLKIINLSVNNIIESEEQSDIFEKIGLCYFNMNNILTGLDFYKIAATLPYLSPASSFRLNLYLGDLFFSLKDYANSLVYYLQAKTHLNSDTDHTLKNHLENKIKLLINYKYLNMTNAQE